jgi:hypothetical protein
MPAVLAASYMAFSTSKLTALVHSSRSANCGLNKIKKVVTYNLNYVKPKVNQCSKNTFNNKNK